MALLITAEASNLAKVSLLLSSVRLSVTPCSWGATFLAFSSFSVDLFLLVLPGLVALSFLGLVSLFGLDGLILDLALRGRAGFLLGLFRLIVSGIKAHLQGPFSLGAPLI